MPPDDPPIFRQLADELLFAGFDPPTSHVPAVTPAAAAAPPDEVDAGVGGHLGTVTDFEWFTAHHQLMDAAPEFAPELDYIWDPARRGAELVDVVERDIAQRRYDPNDDERFHGGGFVRGE